MRLVHVLVPIAVLGLLPAAQASDVATTSLQDTSSPLDMPIEKIADSPGGCTILDKDFPGLRAHSMYPYFKVMTLNQIAAMSKGQITPDMLAQARTDLTALETVPAAGAAAAAPTDIADTPASVSPVAMTTAAPIKTTPVSATVAAVH